MSEHHNMEAVSTASDTPATFRRKVYRLMFEAHDSPPEEKLIDRFIVSLIVLSVCAIGVEHIDALHERFHTELALFDKFSVYFFTFEYLVRLYCIPESEAYQDFKLKRLRYAVTPMALVDFFVIVPFYLTFLIEIDLRFLRVMRLLRILKLTRYSTAMQTLISVVRDELPVLSAALFVSLLISLFASSAIYILEHEAQPDKFNSIPEAMYWSIITLTSVGYGDYYPVTPLGQFFASAAAIIGVVLVALPTGMLASGFSEKIRQQKDELNKMADEAAADGVITEAEHRMMERRAHRMGIADHVEMEIENQAIERAQAHMAELAAAPPPPPPLKAEIKTMLIQLETFTTEEKTQLLSHLADSLSRDVTQAQKLAQGSAVKV